MSLKGFLHNSVLELAARWFLGLLFVYAAYHKITQPAAFAKVIYGYALFPAASINLIAIIVPFWELCAGLALVTGIYPRTAAMILSGMLLGFMVAISINLIRGHEFDCGCFSISQAGDPGSSAMSLLRNAGLFLVGLYVVLYPNSRKACLRQTGGLLRNTA